MEPPPLYMTIEEYAEHIKMGRSTVFALIKRGLPNVKILSTRRVLWQEADEWLAAGNGDATKATATIRGVLAKVGK